MYDYKKHVFIEGKVYKFPMLGYKSEKDLLKSSMWESVTKFLIHSKHPRCECCGEKAKFALPTKVDSDVYLGRFPGFIATLCEDHYDKFIDDREKLVRGLMVSAKEFNPRFFWPKRHKRNNTLKYELIGFVHEILKSEV